MNVQGMIKKSGLDFLKDVEFERVTKGRFFEKEKTDMGNGLRQFFVILGPHIESPIHHHRGQGVAETHLLLYGSGTFIIYDKKGHVEREMKLERGIFHRIFSNAAFSPDHKYVAGPDGSIVLALEKYAYRPYKGF